MPNSNTWVTQPNIFEADIDLQEENVVLFLRCCHVDKNTTMTWPTKAKEICQSSLAVH